MLAEELGGTGVFARIDREPLAAASIAQVHAATLHTGERVVVKILRPGVTSLVERDLDIIARLARRAEARAAWARAIGVVNLAEGFAAALREELDFRIEARNLAAISAADGTADAVVIPRAHYDLSTRRVLVMERLDGAALNKAGPAHGDREELARDLEQALERSVGALLVRHLTAGRTPDAALFTELFRLVTRHELAVPAEFAATFRALSILEGSSWAC